METYNPNLESSRSVHAEHTLHLYSPSLDKLNIQRAFLVSNEKDERAIYVTRSPAASVIGELNSTSNIEPTIIEPEELARFDIEKAGKLRIVVDGDSLFDREASDIDDVYKMEEHINKLREKFSIRCLCTHNLVKLDSERIKRLAKYHNKLLLTTSDVTVLSGDLFDKSELSDDSVERIVKNDLDTIVLALILMKPMCGVEIMATVHRDFNVLLSPAAIYPLLHNLKKRGLLESEESGKAKIYFPANEEAKGEITRILTERVQVSKLLNRYLQQPTTFDENKEPITTRT